MKLWITCTIIVFTLIRPSQNPVKAQASYEEQHIEVALRMIGHQLLLTNQDTLSRVLPVERIEEAYIIKFETELSIIPDSLVKIANKLIKSTAISDGYIVQVLECMTDNIVYSYKVGGYKEMDIIPCQSRILPKDCYRLMLTLEENPSETELVNAVLPRQNNQNFTPSSLKWIVMMLVLIAGSIGLWLQSKRDSSRPGNAQKPEKIGDYRFDKNKALLSIHGQDISLTRKESDLLSLLQQNMNTTLEREELLRKVWGDDGDYVGRTLDVFISKLRKKLELDSRIEISNIRGVGYRLAVAGQ